MAFSQALGFRLAVVLVVCLSAAVVWRLDEERGEFVAALRSRFVLGVPWGTVLVVCFVLAVYLLVQQGAGNWDDPLVIPFRAWSYLYPLGVLTAPFAHAGPGHLLGNLTGTLGFAPIAEFAWSHYPRERDAPATARSPASRLSLPASPFGRVLLFSLGTLAVSVVTSLFALGPVIGFSGVVFALAGLAVVRYPLATVIALSAGGVLRLVYAAVRNPVTVASAEPSFAAPWWAGIAIQGHALGLLCGVLLGVLLVRRREGGPSPLRLWLGVLLFGISQSLWAVYWYRGGETFVLFRAAGVALVFALAGLVAVAVAAPDRSLSDALVPDPVPVLGRENGGRSGFDLDFGFGFSARRLATMVLVAALVGMAVPAVPVNLTAVADERVGGASGAGVSASQVEPNASGTNPKDSNTSNGANGTNPSSPNLSNLSADATVEIRGYTIRYAESVENRLVSVVDVSVFGETTAVNTSGVIVTNPDREIWTTAVSKSRLAFAGRQTVEVGGLGWEEEVGIRRTGWKTEGGNTTYKVFLHSPEGERQLAYAAPAARATPVLDGRNVSITPAQQGYAIVVSRNDTNDTTLGRAPVPAKNGSATIAGLAFDRRGSRLVVTYGDTEIEVAKRESYRGN
jgi:membrane associated rhomboid family serine protease